MEIITLKLSGTNCFLIKNGDKYLLIDTGYEHDWELFCKRIKKTGIVLSAISHIILTHHHDDHCGLINKILEKNRTIQIVLSNQAKDLLLKGKNNYPAGSGMINKRIKSLWNLKHFYLSVKSGKILNKKKNLIFPPYRLRENDIMINGETRLVDIGIELKGKIIETPGHSVDSITLLMDSGECFAGDAAANLLRFAGTKYCIIGMYDLDEYYKSWEKIIAANPRKIYPAHGNPFGLDKLIKNIWKNKKGNMVLNPPHSPF